MTDEKNRSERDLILARRRFFVASALAGVVTTACTPQPCLNVAQPPGEPGSQEAGTSPEGAGGSVGAAGAPGATDADAGAPVATTDATPDAGPAPPPTVCLKVAPPPPHVCLEFAEPPAKK